MAALTIERVRIDSVTVKPNNDDTQPVPAFEGSYSLISSKATVLATNDFNGYNKLKISPSPESTQCLQKLLASLAEDLGKVLGFNEE